MAAFIPVMPVDAVNCPTCDYNNITGAKTYAGTKADGSICGKELLVSIPAK